MSDPAYPGKNQVAPQQPPPPYPGATTQPGPYQPSGNVPPPPPGHAPGPATYSQPPPTHGASYGGMQQYGYGAPGYGGGVTVVNVNHSRFGSTPMRTKCRSCNADITTKTETKLGTYNWLICGYIILIGFVAFPPILLGCCFIPLCISSLKDVEHSCPNCHTVLGLYKRANGF